MRSLRRGARVTSARRWERPRACRSAPPRGPRRSRAGPGSPRGPTRAASPWRRVRPRRGRLARDLRVLQNDRIRVAGAEVAIDVNDALHEDDVADGRGVSGRDGEVVVLFLARAGPVANVNPVPA